MELWRGWHGLTLDSRPDLLSQSASRCQLCSWYIHPQFCLRWQLTPIFLKLLFAPQSEPRQTVPRDWTSRMDCTQNVPCFGRIETDIKRQPWRRDPGRGGESREHSYASVPPDKRQPLLRTASLGFGGSLRSLFPAWEKVAQCACSGFDESPILLNCC